jgi:regulatory protein
MLARKGYGPGIAYRVVREELEAEGEELPVLDTDGLSSLG